MPGYPHGRDRTTIEISDTPRKQDNTANCDELWHVWDTPKRDGRSLAKRAEHIIKSNPDTQEWHADETGERFTQWEIYQATAKFYRDRGWRIGKWVREGNCIIQYAYKGDEQHGK